MRKLIFDTSAILNFGKRGQLEWLLERLGEEHQLVTTPDVEREIYHPDDLVFYQCLFKKRFKIEVAEEITVKLEEMKRLAAVLGSGELSVIFLTQGLGATAVLDERLARFETERLGIRATGTLEILGDAVKCGWMTHDECMDVVRRLRANGYRIRGPGANESFEDYLARIVAASRGG